MILAILLTGRESRYASLTEGKGADSAAFAFGSVQALGFMLFHTRAT